MIKKIGITQRVHTIREYQEHRDELDQSWSKFLNEIGILQIILPNNKDIITNRIINNYDLDGVILTGGEIKNKASNNNSGQINRDEFENNLISYCIEKKIPILGICRGMQMLNLFFGGELINLKNHSGKSHNIKNLSDSKDLPKRVNSFHDFGINKEKLPKNLKIIATDDNGAIEAFEDQDKKIFGIMWHPERNEKFDPIDVKIIKEIFNL
tara:strand:+ start:2093 stop:2725 length:633 start_codon:yes stop_codon:yes gene_type:complete